MITTALTRTKSYQRWRSYIPTGLRRTAGASLREIERQWNRSRFNAALGEFISLPDFTLVDNQLLNRLVLGWDNLSYSAQLDYAKACIEYSAITDGPILECGSGLTTLLMGIVGQRRGVEVWSLEHHGQWAEKIRALLAERDIRSVHLCHCDLTHFGGYHWYAAPFDSMPTGFALVICDGPPATTIGGRYGLLPVMKQRLVHGSKILLDDMNREQEQEIVRRWQNEACCSIEVFGSERAYAVVTYLGDAQLGSYESECQSVSAF